MWREPAEESVDLYPGLVVHDGRRTGSITIGQSRLPLEVIAHAAIGSRWGYVEAGWEPSCYDFDDGDLREFLSCLLEVRGEFARLLLVLADAERREFDRQERHEEEHWRTAHVHGERVCECMVPPLPPWHEDEELRAPVVDQLRRCLDLLDPVRDTQ